MILGGGLAGASAAAILAQDGVRAHLLERSREPAHKICGEFLSQEAQQHLAALGFDLARLGGAPITRLELCWGERRVVSPLPFAAIGLTRLRLDEALLSHAEQLGAEVSRGTTVSRVERGTAVTSAGDLSSEALLLATGKHDLRGARRDAPESLSGSVGFKMYFRLPPAARAALSGAIEVTLFEGGYAGLQLVEGGIANLCLLVSRERFAALGRRWETLFEALLYEHALARALSDAEPLLGQPLTIAGVPYGFVHKAHSGDDPALYRLGDQAAVIPSFSGDGMSIALHSGRLAARTVLAGGSSADYHRAVRREVSGQVRLATTLQRAAETRVGRTVLLGALGLAPAILPLIARRTRVPRGALRRAGVLG